MGRTGTGEVMVDRVSRSSAMPLYAQLAELLRQQIEDGEHAPGDPLPSEAELCAIHGVSRTAVRQALSSLVDDGLVVKEKGRGTFVRRRQATGLVVQEVRGLVEEMAAHGRELRTVVRRQERSPLPPDAAVLLRQPIGSKGIRLDRIRSVDGEPLATSRTWLVSPRLDDLLLDDLEDVSLYAHLQEHHGIEVVGGYRRVEAVAADSRVAKDLEIRKGTPVLRMVATNEDEDREPFEWFEAWYRADQVAVEMLVERRGMWGQA